LNSVLCFYIDARETLTAKQVAEAKWLLSETFGPDNYSTRSFLSGKKGKVVEIGTRLERVTPFCSNARSIFSGCGINSIARIEFSRRYVLPEGAEEEEFVKNHTHFDRATEMRYLQPLRTFETGKVPEKVFIVPLIEEGKPALEKINREMGLGLDAWDIDYYHDLFVKDIGRNPTNVECFDLSQSNSEHSRHWFFKGRLIVNGKEAVKNLMDIVRATLEANPNNSIIAFKDNSSAIKGSKVAMIIPFKPGQPSHFKKEKIEMHIIFTAETHNFPSGVAPFPGAETGTGGRIRDVQATGQGGHVIAGTAAYCVGNLQIPGYLQPWECREFAYPTNLAAALNILLRASDGASDYGNKFGEPVIQGSARSFGLRLLDGERREWLKPIMFTAGVGQMDARHVEKGEPEEGMLVTKIGGPGYRIGMGGGAASSMIQGQNIADLDFNAVQRGDAEMEQKMNRVIRACIEMGKGNPIISAHDQGAGGNCNVVKEIIYPAGAQIELRKIQLGDNTLSTLEIWGAEYQEQNALLIRPERAEEFVVLCKREKVPCAFIGTITGAGYIVLHDEFDGSTPVNLDLTKILGAKVPQKTFKLDAVKRIRKPLRLPKGLTMRAALDRVLRLVSVGSKRFLASKVDRSVTGLIARQQNVGPLQLTLSDVAVIAQSYLGLEGAAISIGEQPIKGLISPEAMARMSVAEALTNMVWALITDIGDIKCSGNWMWAPKLPGEGIELYQAACAMRDIMIELGIAIDGGKDSLSMAAKVTDSSGNTEVVKSPGSLFISAYCTMKDVTKVITPDIKRPGESRLLHIDLANFEKRLGGSALAQVFEQVGNRCPDIKDAQLLKRGFLAVQEMIRKGLILSGHDGSDGGLITTVLEMAFSGNCGLKLEPYVRTEDRLIPYFFSEECGLVIEVANNNLRKVMDTCKKHHIWDNVIDIGCPTSDQRIKIAVPVPKGKNRVVMNESMQELRGIWEETSYQLERLQRNPKCADAEKQNIYDRRGPRYVLTFRPKPTPKRILVAKKKPKVAVIREEGSNGDREMIAAFMAAKFEVWDVTMTDFLEGRINLKHFRVVAFVGGFSYADALDSAKGWAGVIRFNKKIWRQFQKFYKRPDTFSLGVCNGCQLMALLGWVPWQGLSGLRQPRFIHNESGRFESRWSTVRIFDSPAVAFKGMAGSVLGVHVAHGEGRVFFPNEKVKQLVLSENLAPLRYVNDDCQVTEEYPFNPNGSPDGITALCSPDGRHLALMPHPERAFLKWQWHYMPESWREDLKASPWIKIFQNYREACERTEQ